ncbi:hypothetical protein [Terrimonas pollutisoli]|uniref:hypothetical protein n=1 Tax=Terrimonas pollutisoli TaxID=3034147 RepID=UPI0023EDB3D3|nr:hypothetical protein [Terrimonas sp. H1YJ31]
MLTDTIPEIPPVVNQPADLHEFTSGLLNTITTKAVLNKISFINDVPARLPLATDQGMLTMMLEALLSVVVFHARDNCIRLTAKAYGHVVMMYVTDHLSDTPAVETEVCKLLPVAEKMMCSVSVTSMRKDLTTVAFGFVNLPLMD